ncbi:MAG TPA: cyanophycinase [Candidatus Saccharicenans sp.]|nr:cyanophycinase [Candidatus Saccharicenans sp.]
MKTLKSKVFIFPALSIALLTFVSFLLSPIAAQAQGRPKGHLFIIGGGDRSEDMMKKFIELASKVGQGRIVVLPMASSTPEETGKSLVEEFQNLGARDVVFYNFTRREAEDYARARWLTGSGGIFFSGGDQSRITEAILDTPVHKTILDLYQQGAVIGGTSAGAAVMSELMITGDEARKPEEGHEFETIEAGNVILARGLGLVKTAIIDQHFATRKRHNRLISVIAGHPELLGIGIDEETAIIVYPDQSFDVIGNKNVIVYDASKAKITAGPRRSIGIRGLIMHVLLPGERFSITRKK